MNCGEVHSYTHNYSWSQRVSNEKLKAFHSCSSSEMIRKSVIDETSTRVGRKLQDSSVITSQYGNNIQEGIKRVAEMMHQDIN